MQKNEKKIEMAKNCLKGWISFCVFISMSSLTDGTVFDDRQNQLVSFPRGIAGNRPRDSRRSMRPVRRNWMELPFSSENFARPQDFVRGRFRGPAFPNQRPRIPREQRVPAFPRITPIPMGPSIRPDNQNPTFRNQNNRGIQRRQTEPRFPSRTEIILNQWTPFNQALPPPQAGLVNRQFASEQRTSGWQANQLNSQPNEPPTCHAPNILVCQQWPPDRDPSNAHSCQGNCAGRTCTVHCRCVCESVPRIFVAQMTDGPSTSTTIGHPGTETRLQDSNTLVSSDGKIDVPFLTENRASLPELGISEKGVVIPAPNIDLSKALKGVAAQPALDNTLNIADFLSKSDLILLGIHSGENAGNTLPDASMVTDITGNDVSLTNVGPVDTIDSVPVSAKIGAPILTHPLPPLFEEPAGTFLPITPVTSPVVEATVSTPSSGSMGALDAVSISGDQNNRMNTGVTNQAESKTLFRNPNDIKTLLTGTRDPSVLKAFNGLATLPGPMPLEAVSTSDTIGVTVGAAMESPPLGGTLNSHEAKTGALWDFISTGTENTPRESSAFGSEFGTRFEPTGRRPEVGMQLEPDSAMMATVVMQNDPFLGFDIGINTTSPAGSAALATGLVNPSSTEQAAPTNVIGKVKSANGPSPTKVDTHVVLTSDNNVTKVTQSAAARSEQPDFITNFLIGTVLATDPLAKNVKVDECRAQRKQLWCDPTSVWNGTPGLTEWCLLNCMSHNCDFKRCACSCVEDQEFQMRYDLLVASKA